MRLTRSSNGASHERKRCKYTLRAVCGYGMVFERKINFKKNQENRLHWPFTLLVFYEVSANISSIQMKRHLANPCHIGLWYTVSFKNASICTIIKDGRNPVMPSNMIILLSGNKILPQLMKNLMVDLEKRFCGC